MSVSVLAAEGGYQQFHLAGRRVGLADLLGGRPRCSPSSSGFGLVRGVLAADQGTPTMQRHRQGDPRRRDGLPPAPVPHHRRSSSCRWRRWCSSAPRRSPSPAAAIALSFGASGAFRTGAFIAGAFLSGLTGFIGMSLAVRGNVRTAAAARTGSLRDALKVAFRTGGVAGMYTVGLGLLGATGDHHDLPEHRDRDPGRLRVRRLAARAVHARRRRHLHQGGRRRRRPRRQGRAGHPRGRPPQPGDDRRQRGRQRRRLRRDGRRPLRVLRGHPRRRDHPRRPGVRVDRRQPGARAASSRSSPGPSACSRRSSGCSWSGPPTGTAAAMAPDQPWVRHRRDPDRPRRRRRRHLLHRQRPRQRRLARRRRRGRSGSSSPRSSAASPSTSPPPRPSRSRRSPRRPGPGRRRRSCRASAAASSRRSGRSWPSPSRSASPSPSATATCSSPST